MKTKQYIDAPDDLALALVFSTSPSIALTRLYGVTSSIGDTFSFLNGGVNSSGNRGVQIQINLNKNRKSQKIEYYWMCWMSFYKHHSVHIELWIDFTKQVQNKLNRMYILLYLFIFYWYDMLC